MRVAWGTVAEASCAATAEASRPPPGWRAARLGPADLYSAGFSAVGRSSWVFGREPYFAKYSSLVAQREKLRGSIGSSLAVFFAGPLVQ